VTRLVRQRSRRPSTPDDDVTTTDTWKGGVGLGTG
jgi:hypothetical protein